MAQKITLSIPDMLHEKVTQWRSSFNFSRLFQEALTEAIQKKEALQKRFSDEFDMPDIIQRLREEKQAWENKFFRAGKRQGLVWARAAHFEDLLYVLHHEDTYDLIGHENFKTYFQGIYQEYELGKYSGEGGTAHEHKFMEGWFQGVRSFWNEIKEQI
jgi:hypothetical protein